ncbi:outer membrane beta-barrel protein [Bacteroidota bacterium]
MTGDMKKIDNLFSKGFQHAEQKPPAYMWGKISSSLEAAAGRKRRVLIWYAAASVALMAAFTSGYYLASYNNGKIDLAQSEEAPSAVIQKMQEANQAVEGIVNSDVSDQLVTNIPTQPIVDESKLVHAIKPTNSQPQFISPKVDTESILVSEDNKIDQSLVEDVADVTMSETAVEVEKEVISKIDAEPELPENPVIPPIAVPSTSRWRIGIQAAPQLAYRDIRNSGSNIFLLAASVPDNYGTISTSDKSYYNQIESPLVAFTGGLNVNYNFSKRLLIESGLIYSQTGQVTQEMFVYEENILSGAGSQFEIINSSAGDINSSGQQGALLENLRESQTYLVDKSADGSWLYLNTSNLILKFDYLELPLILKYKLIDRKIDVLFAGGLTTGLLIGNNAYAQNKEDKVYLGQTDGIRTVTYSGTAGISVEYELSSKFDFTIEPRFRYGLQTINKTYYIQSYPYSFSMYAGLQYTF